MFMVSEQGLINWSEIGDGIHITAEVICASWEAALQNGVKWFYWQPVPKDEKGDGLHHFII